MESHLGESSSKEKKKTLGGEPYTTHYVVKSMAMEGLGYERRDAGHIQNTAAPHSRVKR